MVRKHILMVLLHIAVAGSALGYDLGGECIDPNTRTATGFMIDLQTFMDPQREALKSADYDTAIGLQKEIIRLQCGNDYHWFYLTELMLDAKRYQEAVEVLTVLYDRQSNEIEDRLEEENYKYHVLLSVPEYQNSTLATRIAANKAKFEKRNALFRERVAALDAASRPPDHYVAKDVCPFECCQYRDWEVLQDTVLYDQPNGSTVVGEAKQGETVIGITGDVHTVPWPIAVLESVQLYQPPLNVDKGEIVFELDYMGEGFAHIWRRGTVAEIDVAGVVKRYCPFPRRDCWGEYILGEPDEQNHHWWVKIELPDSSVGWTEEINFGNIDGCG